jgi:hypothetical protein
VSICGAKKLKKKQLYVRVSIIWTPEFICPSWTNGFHYHRFNINIVRRLRFKACYLLGLFHKERGVCETVVQDFFFLFLFFGDKICGLGQQRGP